MIHFDRRRLLALAMSGAAGLMLPARAALAEDGVFTDRILFGQAAALSGPAAALGTGMRQGILAAFKEANDAGGVNGRRLDLLSVDDGYDPQKSIDATRRLIEDEKIFALIGPVGTPTSNATQPIAEAADIPFVGPFTGAESLRGANRLNVVNVRASYFQETEMMVERLTRDFGARRIAILYQDDAFGRAGLTGLRKAMERRKMELVAEGTFQRNTTAVKMALIEIRRREPDAVVLIGPYRPCAEFIRVARRLKFNPKFVNISFVGSNALAEELGADGDGVMITQVVPFPEDTSIPLVARYHAALAAHDPKEAPGFVSLEGYVVGLLAVEALKDVSGEPTRAAFLDAVRSRDFDFGGMILSYGQVDNQGSDAVFMTAIGPDGRFRPIATTN